MIIIAIIVYAMSISQRAVVSDMYFMWQGFVCCMDMDSLSKLDQSDYYQSDQWGLTIFIPSSLSGAILLLYIMLNMRE